MTKRNNKGALVVILLVAVFVIGINVLPAIVGPLDETSMDINTIVDSLVIKAYNPSITDYEISQGDTVEIESEWWEETRFTVGVQFSIEAGTNTRLPPPSDFTCKLWIDGVVQEIDSTPVIPFASISPNWRFDFTDLTGITQGTHDAWFTFHGLYHIGYPPTALTGTSITFKVHNPNVATPDPIVLTPSELPVDITIDAYESVVIAWEYQYAGTLSIEVTDDGITIPSSIRNVGISLVPTIYSFTFVGAISGEHPLVVTFSPTDGLGNLPVSDSMNVHVNVGGDTPDFPPDVDRIDITVTQAVVNEVPRNIFLTSWFSDVAYKGTVSVVIDGFLDISVAVRPSGAFDAMKVLAIGAEDELQTPLLRGVGWYGDTFTGGFDTDELEAGIYTVEFWGWDASIATWYLVGEFTVPIRTSSAFFDPLIFIGIVIAGIGLILVIVLTVNRRKK